MTVPVQLVTAVENLWRMPPLGTASLTKRPAFIKITEVCDEIYGFPHVDSALSNALRSLGAPFNLPKENRDRALNPELAALKLHEAMTSQTVRRRHLCPLDLCDELPSIRFGNSVVGEFSELELAEFFDVERLARFYPTFKPPVRQLMQFRWLVVEEHVAVDPRPEARALPMLFIDLSQDFGEIDPHLGRFPPAVEAAIFFLLLAPWEDWAIYPEVNWRAFRIPWFHTVDDDLFVRPMAPPSPDTLSLQPDIAYDRYGDEVEIERPTVNSLEDEARTDFTRMNESLWQNVLAARAGVLFETPIVHLIVRAFLADGMDEVMAHMTAIEAGLGLEMDHRRGLRPKPDAHRNVSASDRTAARLAALLSDTAAAVAYRELFELRSSYVHGRAGLAKIPTPCALTRDVSHEEWQRRSWRNRRCNPPRASKFSAICWIGERRFCEPFPFKCRKSMTNIQRRVARSVSEYLEVVEKIAPTTFAGLWFRGQPNARYQLTPNVLRDVTFTTDGRGQPIREDQIVRSSGSAVAGLNSERMLDDFKRRARPFLERELKNDFEWMFLAQHHGLPTRLLDWSTNALVALYFAASGAREGTEDADEACADYLDEGGSEHRDDGFAVFVIDPGMINSIVCDLSDPIDVAAAPELWAHYLRPTDHMIKAYAPICVTAPHVTPRLRAQSGTFTLHGSNIGALDWYTMTRPHITKIFIPNSVTRQIVESLRRSGLTQSFIYPGLDSIAADIRIDETIRYRAELKTYFAQVAADQHAEEVARASAKVRKPKRKSRGLKPARK